MQRLTTFPPELKYQLKQQYDFIALVKAAKMQFDAIIPIRPAFFRFSQSKERRIIIIPATGISVGDLYKGKLTTRSIRYFVANTRKPFPVAHIFESSGSICYGSLFIPDLLDPSQITLPLDTILLANDGNTRHGNAKWVVTAKQLLAVNQLLKQIDFPSTFEPESKDLVKQDALWGLTADLYDFYQQDVEQTIHTCNQLFEIIFPKAE